MIFWWGTLRTIAVLLQPARNIFAVPTKPGDLGADAIETLSECSIEAISILILEECLYLGQLLRLRQAGCRNLHHGAQGWECGREAFVELIPVLRQPREECLDTLGVTTQTGSGEGDVLTLDLAAEEQAECLLDKLWLLSTTQGAQGSVALITVG